MKPKPDCHWASASEEAAQDSSGYWSGGIGETADDSASDKLKMTPW